MWTLSTPKSEPPIPDGTYALVNSAGFAMDDPGGGGVDQTNNTGTNQRWTVALVRGIQYKIVSASGAALTGATPNAPLTLASYTGADDQLWVFQTNGAAYSVLNVGTGQAIDDNGGGGLNKSVWSYAFWAGNGNQAWSLARVIPGGSYALFDALGFALNDPNGGGAGTAPDQFVYSGTDQQWTVTNVSGTLYEIAGASGYALTSGTATGTVAGLSSYTGATNQLWGFAPAGGGYNVVNAATGFVLDANGGGQGRPCVERQWDNTPNQFWTLTPTSMVSPPIATGTYVLVGSAGFALDDPGGAAVSPDQVPYSGADQSWTVTLVSGSDYRIISSSGYALTSGTTNGTLAALSSYTGAANQLWWFAPAGGGAYSLVSAGTRLVLDDNGGSGGGCDQRQWAGTIDQIWTVTAASAAAPPFANGVYRFIDNAGFALDDPSGDSAGTTPDQVPYSGAAQNWTVTLVNGFEYKIIGSNGNALTSAATNGPAGLSSYTGASNQLWTFVPGGGGTYYVVNAGTGLILHQNGGAAGVICTNWQWYPGATLGQNWTLISE
jgi:hypothetical protein